ncbi:hypothetical protein F4604DRAFT_1920151 [Suillus subluteus]|nr:hypothetical protein F4604DRAFT_1920151 [Suillus subluteus]
MANYILRKDVRQEWESLEQKLLWCQQQLAVNIHFPWYGQPPRPPRDYGYLKSHVDVKLAKKVAMRSRDAFLGLVLIWISAICTYFIMARQYRPHNDLPTWTSLLINDPRCLFYLRGLAWDVDVIMFEHFKVLIWVHWPAGIPSDKAWKCYLPSADDVTAVTCTTSQNSDPWGAQLDLHPWLTQSNDALDPESSQSAPSQQDLSRFLLPKKNSGQRHGEDWQAFFARRAMQNVKKEAKETPSQ